jgi:tetraacyldisaccharide 4'-kinase
MLIERRPPDFWYEEKTALDKFWSRALSPFGIFYAWAVRQRFDLYHPVPMARPVICVGNLVAGGSGKTPVVMSLIDFLQDAGYNPHILTRGYGGSEAGPLQVAPNRDTAEDVGDEALLLVNKAPTWVSRARALGAQEAIDTGANIIVMDDGFQNPSMYKNFSILVVDGGVGFGNGKVMPAGPLREEISLGLSRAQAVVIIGDDKTGAENIIRRHVPDLPVFHAMLVPQPGNPDVRGQNIFAFAGIGRPEKFRETLEAEGAVIEGWGSYPDHMPYTEEDLQEIFSAAETAGSMILTTEKDYVRLPARLKEKVKKFAVALEWQDSAGLVQLIKDTLQKYS